MKKSLHKCGHWRAGAAAGGKRCQHESIWTSLWCVFIVLYVGLEAENCVLVMLSKYNVGRTCSMECPNMQEPFAPPQCM